MPIQNPEELFMTVLSNIRAREEKSGQIWQEMSNMVQNQEVKEIVDTRSFVHKELLSNIDECFRLLGKQPSPPTTTRFQDAWIEDFRSEANEIQVPALRAVYVLHKTRELIQVHAAAYRGLIAMAEYMHDFPVSALLETNYAIKMAFVERTKEVLRELGEAAISGKLRRAA